MKTLKRYHIENASYFITCVTYKREPILIENADYLIECWKEFSPDAYVILPDHFHLIVKVSYSTISNVMHSVKTRFSRYIRDSVRSGRVWQNRFWDHMIRNDEDMKRHIDYIHYNPVKHGIVKRPADYEFSTFELYVNLGQYDKSWCEDLVFTNNELFGE